MGLRIFCLKPICWGITVDREAITKKNSVGKFSQKTNQAIDIVFNHEVLTVLEQRFSKYGPQTNSISTTLELTVNANSKIYLQTSGSETLGRQPSNPSCSKASRYFWVTLRLESTGLELLYEPLENTLHVWFSWFLAPQFCFFENLFIVFHTLCSLIVNISQVNIAKKLKFYYFPWSL